MSSDLWAAFGSPQPSTAAKADSDSAGYNGQGSDLPKNAHQFKQSRTGGGDNHDDSDADSWSAVNDELENAWHKTEEPNPFASMHSNGPPPINQTSSFSLTFQAEEDDFGDFEDAKIENPTTTTHIVRGEGSGPDPGNSARIDDPDDFGDFAEPETDTRSKLDPKPARNSGPLEALEHLSIGQQGQPTRSNVIPASESLLDLGSPTTTEANPTRNEVAVQQKPAPKKVAFKEQPILYAESDSDDSGNWDDLAPSQMTSNTSALQRSKLQRGKDPKSPAKASSRSDATPPTNLPPPSILMALVSSILSELPERIRVTIVETWEEDEADVKTYIDTFQVTARILAGRKLRWKRDKLLAQNMSIGMSGRQGGMKLVGVDRIEAQREEREAAELVRNWRQHLGPIRSALAESGTSSSSKPLALPLIADAIVVRTVKPEDGGITAAKCCIICGLKRDERADKVDTDVWDQFGEWWTEHWGHTTCKNFWLEYQSYLQQR